MSIEKKGAKHRDIWHTTRNKTCQEYLRESREQNMFSTNDADLFWLKVGTYKVPEPSYILIPGLSDVYSNFKTKIDLMKAIVNAVCKVTHIEYNVIMGKSRRRDIVDARFLCVKLIYDIAKVGPSEAGKFFEKDHSSMIHAKKKYEELMELYPEEYTYKYKLIHNLFTQ